MIKNQILILILMAKSPNRKKKSKRALKFLANCRHPKVVKEILRHADNSLVKGICNAAYNVTQGDLPLSRQKKRLFGRHRRLFLGLTSPKVSIGKKRKVIQRGGGVVAAIVPILLSTVISALGSRLFRQ